VKVLITAVIACAATLAVVLAVWLVWLRDGKDDLATAVRVEKPVRGDLVEVVRASGTIEPKTKVGISARVSALIVDIPHREGEAVTKGNAGANPRVPPSVLVRLDDKDLQAVLSSAESRRAGIAAGIEVARARLETARDTVRGIRVNLEDALRSLAREKELVQKRISPQSSLDAAQCLADKLQADLGAAEHTLTADEMNLEVMRHELAAAKAEVVRCTDNLAYTTITSPLDGIVTRVKAEVGEMAMMGTMNNPGTEILQVADLSKMLLLAEVDEAFIGAVHAGQKAKVRIQAYPGRIFEGTVDSVALVQSVSVRTGSKYFETRILVNTDWQRILSGLTADVDIQTQCHSGVLKVPTQAVLGRRVDDLPATVRDASPNVPTGKAEIPVVYRFIDGKAVVTPVKIGAADATCTEIVSGLADDARVIVGPYKVLETLRHDQAAKDDRAAKTPPAPTPTAPAGAQPATVTVGHP
jgi:HlyD family secretion protein